jgi:hypothetical protein
MGGGDIAAQEGFNSGGRQARLAAPLLQHNVVGPYMSAAVHNIHNQSEASLGI